MGKHRDTQKEWKTPENTRKHRETQGNTRKHQETPEKNRETPGNTRKHRETLKKHEETQGYTLKKWLFNIFRVGESSKNMGNTVSPGHVLKFVVADRARSTVSTLPQDL